MRVLIEYYAEPPRLCVEFPDRIIRSRFFRLFSTIRGDDFLVLKPNFSVFSVLISTIFQAKKFHFPTKIRQITQHWTEVWRLFMIKFIEFQLPKRN